MAIPNYQNKMNAPNTGGLDVMRLSNVMDAMEQSQRIAQQTQQNVREAEKHTIDARSEIMKLPLEVDKLKREIRSQAIKNEKDMSLMPYEIELKKQESIRSQHQSMQSEYDLRSRTIESEITSKKINAEKIARNDALKLQAFQNDWEGQLNRAIEGMSFEEIQNIDQWVDNAGRIFGDGNMTDLVKQYREKKRAFLESYIYKKDPNLVNPNDIETARSNHYKALLDNPNSHPLLKEMAGREFANVISERDARLSTQATQEKNNAIERIITETGATIPQAERILEQENRVREFNISGMEMVNILDNLDATMSFTGKSFDEVWAMPEFAEYQNNVQLKEYVKNEYEITKQNQVVRDIEEQIQEAATYAQNDKLENVTSVNKERFANIQINSPSFKPESKAPILIPGGENIANWIVSTPGNRKRIIDGSPFGSHVNAAMDFEIDMLVDKLNNPNIPIPVKEELTVALSQIITDKVWLGGAEGEEMEKEFNLALQTYNLFGLNIGISKPSKRAKETVNTLGEHIRSTNGIFKAKNTIKYTYGTINKLANLYSTPTTNPSEDAANIYAVTAGGYKTHMERLRIGLELSKQYVNELEDKRIRFKPKGLPGSVDNENDLKDPTK